MSQKQKPSTTVIKALNPPPLDFPGDGRLIIGFSGGADSTALGHLLARSGVTREIICVHVDHGLDRESQKRAEQAAVIAEQLNLEFHLETAEVDRVGSLEAAARKVRYQLLQGYVGADDCLLTAHHADDQIETILFRLLRGAGPGGLAGIPRLRTGPTGWVLRPLLDWTRSELQAYCRANKLVWIEDPGNQDLGADRNYLRHRILPLLTERWPNMDQGIRRAGLLAGQAANALESLVEEKVSEDLRIAQSLKLHELQTLSRFQLAEVLRLWCRRRSISPPPGKPLDEFLDQIASGSRDRQPELRWEDRVLRCWNNALWLSTGQLAQDYEIKWQTDQALKLPTGFGTLELCGDQPGEPLCLSVSSGHDGERLRLHQGSSRRKVSELFRQAGIPPWQRQLWPRISKDQKLLAVGDRWISDEFRSFLKQKKLRLNWREIESLAVGN